MRQPTPVDLVARFARSAGVGFELVRTLPGGRAFEIERHDTRRFVLKFDTDAGSKVRRREAIGEAERLGVDAGWPVPSFDLVEDDEYLFVLQSLMPGKELAFLSRAVVDQIIELIEATRGHGVGAKSNWPVRLLDTLVAEPATPTMYCDHEPLQRHSQAGVRLIDTIERIGADLDCADLGESTDLMHWDLHPGNILVDGDHVTAIIDFDNAAAGPCDFDLITFALSARTLRSDSHVGRGLTEYVKGRVSHDLWVASVAHLVMRFANFGLRTDHLETADFWIAQGDRLLGDVSF